MNLIIKRTKIFGLIKYAIVSMLILILPIMSSCRNPYSDRCKQEARSLHTAMMVIANNPRYSNIEISESGLKVDIDGIIVDDDTEAKTLGEILEAETGIKYTITEYTSTNQRDIVKPVSDQTFYVVDNALTVDGYYSVVGKLAKITWATGVVTIL